MASAKQIAWRKKFAKMAKSGKFKKAKRTSRTGGKKSHQMSMEKEYYLTFKGQKIPYEFSALKKTIVLDKNRRDFPTEVNKILKRKYPQITSIEHNSGYFTFD